MKSTLIVVLMLLAIGSACMVGGFWRFGNYADPFDDYEFGSGPGWRSGMRAGVGVSPGLLGLGGIGLLLSFLFANTNHQPQFHTVHHHHYYQEKPGGGYEYKHSSQNPSGGGGYEYKHSQNPPGGGGGQYHGYHPNGNPKPGSFSNFFKNMFYK